MRVPNICSAWSAMTYQLPCNLDSLQMSVIDEQAKNDMTSAGRRCMPGPQNEGDETGSPIHGVDTAQQQASLSQIIHDTVSLHCGYHGVVTAREMIGCYKRFLNWKNDLPKPVGDTQTDHQPLPHVLSLQYVAQVRSRQGMSTDRTQHSIPRSHCPAVSPFIVLPAFCRAG